MYKKFALFILAIALCLFPQVVTAGDDPPVDESKFIPKIKLSSPSTVEVQAGKSNNVYIEVKNVGTGRASNFLIQAVPEPDHPFTVTVMAESASDILNIGASKRIRLVVTVEGGAQGKVYPLKLQYSYINDFRAQYDNSDTLNVKVNNPLSAAVIRLYNFELLPSSLKAGETGELFFNYMNTGAADERNVQLSLEGLDPAIITVPDGLNSQLFSIVRSHTEEKTSFKIKAASALKNGSYPIKIVTTIKSSAGESASEELTYYIPVGGAAETGDASLDVVNTSAPRQTYGVGESFEVSFELFNSSEYDAHNVHVKANALDGNTIVPTSQSMFNTRILKAGESQKYTVSFAATSEAKSQNYPVSFSIDYDAAEPDKDGQTSKISFSQYFGVNITNPEADKKDDDEKENKNIPKIIVSSYSCEPTIVKAGQEFDLAMTFMNTHRDKLVRNIKISLTVTDKDENVGASIFSPVQASNTIFIDEIAPKETASRTIRYYAIPDAKPQTYSITVIFEYEDAEGNQIKEQEIVGINVSQPPSIETTEIIVPDFGEMGVPIFANFQIYNTGKVSVSNMRAVLEGNMEADMGKTFWIGNMESGQNEYVDISFYYTEPGQQTGKIIVSYDSPTGEHFEVPTDFTISISEPMMLDPGMFPEDIPPEMSSVESHKGQIMIGGGIAAVALAFAGYFGFKHFKKKKESDLYE